MTRPQRILIVNPFGIGDVLFTTPLIRALREAFPESWIGYLCNRRTERILQGNPHLNALFIYEKDDLMRLWRASPRQGLAYLGRLLGQIRRARVDLVVDVSLGERYAFLLACLGIARRIGFNYRRRGRFLTESLPIGGYHETHVVEYYRRLAHFMGIRWVAASLELRASEEDARWAERWVQEHRARGAAFLVGIVPAGGASWGVDAPFRRWNLEGFAAVGDALAREHGAQVLLFGETADASLCASVARLMRVPVIDVSGQTSLGQFVSLLAKLDLVICNDGGPLHLAVSQQVKTVSVFGPVDPQVYGPYAPASSQHRVVCRDDLPCRPCYHQFRLPPCPYERACLTTIEPREVLEACRRVLGLVPATPAVN